MSGVPVARRSQWNGSSLCSSRPRVGSTVIRQPYKQWMMDSPLDFDELAKRLTEELKDTAGSTSSDSKSSSSELDAAGHFEILNGNGGIPMVRLRHEGSGQLAEVYTYGACLTSWSVRGSELMWVSEENKWESGGKPIRGGIPLCWPQFGPYGKLVSHGFARISNWTIKDTLLNSDSSVSAVFSLDSKTGTHEELKKWGYDFEAEYTVTLSNVGLEAKMTVTNTGSVPMPFSFAFHNYFATSNIDEVRLFGFEESRHYNRLDEDRELPPPQGVEAGMFITEETDRIYLDAPEELAIFDFNLLRVIKIKKTSTLPNATLWNPYGAEGCDPGWRNFVCVEPAAISPAASIAPGETWVGAQLLGVE